MRHVLVIEHAHDTPLGSLGHMMDERDIRYDVVNVEDDPIPDAADYQAIIALGGPQHVGDYERYPYFSREEELIRAAISTDVPYLGICLGGQLLAHALGGDVGPHRVPELGFSEVQLTNEGKKDPLFARLPNHQMIFLWHLDSFALPPGGVLLASNKYTRNQAFRYGQRAYGLQYHIELTSELFSMWLRGQSEELAYIRGPGALPILEAEWAKSNGAYKEHSAAMFCNFLKVSALA
jgi:GMP synthase (glutamine-hydrolysing)